MEWKRCGTMSHSNEEYGERKKGRKTDGERKRKRERGGEREG